MARLWQRMLETLFSSKEAQRRRRTRSRRSLRLESLENRALMAANITGLVFTDANDNGTRETGEALLGNVTVTLYRDGGNTTFDNGGADDTLIGSVATPASGTNQGRYTFNVNQTGTYFVVETTPTGQVQRASQRVQSVNVSSVTAASVQTIDNYSNLTAIFNADVAGTNPNSLTTSGLPSTDVLGTVQDLYANAAAGSLSMQSNLGNSGVLDLGNSSGGQGSYLITYDGDSTNGANQLGTLLGGATANSFDMTVGGTASFVRLRIAGEARPAADATLTLRIRNAAGVQTIASNVVIPERASSGDPLLDLDIALPTSGVDLTTVGAIQIEISNDPGQQIVIDSIGLFGDPTVTQNIANLNPMTLGNRVFRDLNNNGLLDGADSGINGVTVLLYEDTDGNDVLDAGELSAQPSPRSAITATVSTVAGTYVFDQLVPDDYIIVVPDSQFAASAALDNMVASIIPGSPPGNNANTGVTVTGLGVATAVALVAGAAPTTDGDSDNNTDLSRDFGFAPPTLTIVKDDNPDTARVGEQLTYTLTVTNTSPSGSSRDSTNTVITDTLPAGLTPVGNQSFTVTNPNGTGGTATFNSGTRLITANVGVLVPGQIATLTVIATVDSAFQNPTTNTGRVVNSEGSDVSGNVVTPLAPNVDLSIDKSILNNLTTVGVGGTLSYVLTITNNSNIAVTGVTVNDDLPTGFTPGNLPSGVATGTAPADLVWTVGNLAANGTQTVTIPVNVGTGVTPGPTFNNVATIVTAGQSFTDSNPNNNSDSANIAVEPRYNLRVTKTNNLTALATGQTFTYTITAINDGPSSATNVTVSDALPSTLEFISSSVGSANGQQFTANVGTLTSGASSTPISVVVRVRSSATGANIANTASVTADNASTQENNPNDNTATDTDPLTRTATLNITKSDSTDPVIAGGANFTYTITAFNSGNADTANATFTDILPTGVDFVSGTFAINETTPRQGNVSFDTATRTVSANLGTLLPGSATTNRALITLTVRAPATAAAGTVTNTARLTSADNTTGVTDSEDTTISRDFDVTVSKTDNDVNNTVSSGDTLVYRIVITNSGPSTATNVSLSDPIPSNLTFASVTSSAGTFTNNGGTITGTLATLAQGSPVTVTLTTTVNNNTPDGTQISNTATVTAAGESNPANNTANASSTVANEASLSGFVYVDANRNNVRDTNESGISNVLVTITATINGQPVERTATTNSNGQYVFEGLRPGVYTVTQTQPSDFNNGATNVGSTGGIASTNQIASITLNGGANSVDNNFGETRVLSKRRFLASTRATN